MKTPADAGVFLFVACALGSSVFCIAQCVTSVATCTNVPAEQIKNARVNELNLP
jgi:hypothetical protein